jgi:tetraacyldisaccharide 4'-kinase
VKGGIRRTVEDRMRRYWGGEPGMSRLIMTAVTAPLASLYGLGVRGRNLAFEAGLFQQEDPPIPVVSVGNLAVGGTGKTPITRWVVDLLRQGGSWPAVVSRGYGEDELLLHRRWNPEVPVIRAPRRIRGVLEAAGRGCDVAVLDDGFQHRWLGRHVDLVLLSPAHPFPPRVLPRGPYRERLGALRRAHLLLVTAKGEGEMAPARALVETLASIPGLPPSHMLSLLPGPWETLSGDPAPAPEGPVLAVGSVARPESVWALLEEVGVSCMDVLAFPDHHPYREGDVEEILRRAGGRMVVTTEKDAVKLEVFQDRLHSVRVLPLRVEAGSTQGRSALEAVTTMLGSMLEPTRGSSGGAGNGERTGR